MFNKFHNEIKSFQWHGIDYWILRLLIMYFAHDLHIQNSESLSLRKLVDWVSFQHVWKCDLIFMGTELVCSNYWKMELSLYYSSIYNCWFLTFWVINRIFSNASKMCLLFFLCSYKLIQLNPVENFQSTEVKESLPSSSFVLFFTLFLPCFSLRRHLLQKIMRIQHKRWNTNILGLFEIEIRRGTGRRFS